MYFKANWINALNSTKVLDGKKEDQYKEKKKMDVDMTEKNNKIIFFFNNKRIDKDESELLTLICWLGKHAVFDVDTQALKEIFVVDQACVVKVIPQPEPWKEKILSKCDWESIKKGKVKER